MLVNEQTMKSIVELLKGKEITFENIEAVCKKLGFEKTPKIGIGSIRKTPEGDWVSIYYNNMIERLRIDKNNIVL